MPGRANELIVIPDSFWERSETAAALRDRDMGRFFALVQQHTGASQTQIGMACGGMTQGKISDIMRGIQEVKHLDKFDEIADGLKMPDAARVILGLAPKATPHPTSQNSRGPVVLGETNTVLQSSYASGLLNLDSGDEQEDDDDVRRRVFVGLTGAAMLDAMFADTAPDAPPLHAEPFAPVLAGHAVGIASETPDQASNISALTAAVDNARRQYQECHYSELIKYLPALLTRLHAACLALTGEAQSRAFTLSADAHHVAAGLLLGNVRWTAFGPTNAKIHRVNIAVTLGDAGTAIDVARKIDPTTMTVTERRATLLVDTARAFLQWGKHDKAYIALRAAEETAHEEVAGRPSVHRLIGDLLVSAPPSIRRDVKEFAVQMGVAR